MGGVVFFLENEIASRMAISSFAEVDSSFGEIAITRSDSTL